MARTPHSPGAYDPTEPSSSAPTNVWRDPPPAEPPTAPGVFSAFPDYEFLRELGRGGMGVVFLVRNRPLDRLEAVKVMTRPWLEDRFRQEVRAAARLRHPNVVTVHAALIGSGCLAYAMEYVEGETLSNVVQRRGPLPVPLACSYARQAARGLQHAHERGMTHRDVKPQNLMLALVEGQETVKVLDFGLAKMAAPEGDAVTVTLDGEVLGTPGYVAPEQLREPSAADVRADVYSLGVTLRFLLTGDSPTAEGRPHAGANGAVRGGWPAGLAGVLGRMTAWDPADRYQAPAAVADALEPFVAPPPPAAAVPRGRRRRGWGRLAAGAAVGLLVGLPAAVVISQGGRPSRPDRAAASALSPPPAEVGFVPIFNGTDLSGWVMDGGAADQWHVAGGAIVTAGVRGGPQTWLLSGRDYGDVRVRFEYQLDPGGNSGFAFRAVPGERPVLRPGGPPTPVPYHQQVELSDDADKAWSWLPTGQISGGTGRDAPALKPVPPTRPRPPGGWNSVEIELAGQSLKVTLNGELIQPGDLDDLVRMGSTYPALTRSRGRIGFQQLAKTVRFRKVEVLELPRDRTRVPAGAP